jgi:hypothetical protein
MMHFRFLRVPSRQDVKIYTELGLGYHACPHAYALQRKWIRHYLRWFTVGNLIIVLLTIPT